MSSEPTSSLLIPNILGSASASIIARIFTHPLDTAKARLQAIGADLPKYKGTWDVLKTTARVEGLRGLYRGFGPVFYLGTPGTAIYLCSYDAVKHSLLHYGTGHDFIVHFTAGMIAETLACIIYVPVDVVKERMQVQQNRLPSDAIATNVAYRNTWDAFQRILATEGLSGIYKGYAATLGSFGPFSALYFVFYEKFKLWTRQHLGRNETPSNQDGDMPLHWLILCSSTAGALSSWVTSPLDMAKLRLQVQRGNSAMNGASVAHSGVFDCMAKAYQLGGLAGLFRGAGARVIYTVPATTITMTCYETCRSFFAKRLVES